MTSIFLMTLRRVAPYLVPYFPQMPTFLVWLPYNNTNHSESLFTDITHTLRGEESSAQEGDLTIVMKRSNKLKTIKYLSTTSSLIHSFTHSLNHFGKSTIRSLSPLHSPTTKVLLRNYGLKQLLPYISRMLRFMPDFHS